MRYRLEEYYQEYEQVNGATCNRLMDEVNELEERLKLKNEELEIAYIKGKEAEKERMKIQLGLM